MTNFLCSVKSFRRAAPSAEVIGQSRLSRYVQYFGTSGYCCRLSSLHRISRGRLAEDVILQTNTISLSSKFAHRHILARFEASPCSSGPSMNSVLESERSRCIFTPCYWSVTDVYNSSVPPGGVFHRNLSDRPSRYVWNHLHGGRNAQNRWAV